MSLSPSTIVLLVGSWGDMLQKKHTDHNIMMCNIMPLYI